MLPEHFSFQVKDLELETWLESNLGSELFREYDYQRLQRHLGHYRDFFKAHSVPIVIVGGTNGKGETALFLEKLCLNNEIDTFLWSSPHILSVRERISVRGRPISSDRLFNVFDDLKGDTKELSYYEFLFKCFCEHSMRTFQLDKPSIIILEVGLGGRLDATNFFDCDVSLLTSISRDHTAILGHSLEAILKEKIEITRKGAPLFSAISQEFLRNKIDIYCSDKGLAFYDCAASLQSKDDFHTRNKELAQRAFSYLLKSKFSIQNDAKLSLEGSVWGRPLKVTYKGCQFILVGSHNLDGLRHLARWAHKSQQQESERYLVFDQGFFGFSRQEESELYECLKIIEKSPCLGSKRRVFNFSHQRATPIDLLKTVFNQLGDSELTGLSLENEFQGFIKELEEDQTVLVSGSYYFLSAFVHILFKLGKPKFS